MPSWMAMGITKNELDVAPASGSAMSNEKLETSEALVKALDKSTGDAQQYGYIQPDHRYLIHAVSLYTNLTTDNAAQEWLNPAATSAAKQGGPQVAVQ